jgi:hypothetical protein
VTRLVRSTVAALLVVIVAACTTSPTPSPRIPLTREQAIATARGVAGAQLGLAAVVVVSAEAGPFAQFEPDPNGKMSPPPPDRWVWYVVFHESDGMSSSAIIDYVTGAVVEFSIGIAN